ncbi:MAG: hypothetical protein AB8G11_00750 [Saprospiraceae bacterium]
MNIFTNITSLESIYILLWLLGAFLIGLLIGWWIWGVAKRAVEAELADWKAKYQELRNENDTLKAEIETSKTTYAELKADYDWKAQRLHDIETEKGDLHTKIYRLKDKLKTADNTNLTFRNQIQGLNASYNGAKSEIATLEMKAKGLETELKEAGREHNNLNLQIEALEKQLDETKVSYSSTNDTSAAMEADLETANETIANLNIKIADLENNIIEYKSMVVDLQSSGDDLKAATARIAVLEGKIAGLTEQLDNAEENLADCRAEKADLHAAAMMAAASEEEQKEITIEDAKTAITVALGTTIGTATAAEKDDLTNINGIGEFIENKLNDLGIFTFRQLAKFDDTIVANVTRAIEFFPGRIERDEWIPQAKGFVGESYATNDVIEVEGAPVSNISAAEAREQVREILNSKFPTISADDKDDLKIISGVGPFIEEKLNSLGIFTYEQISSFDKKMVDLITNAIEFFPERIERDEWVKQAKTLFDAKSNE